jgi:hypothetical protein
MTAGLVTRNKGKLRAYFDTHRYAVLRAALGSAACAKLSAYAVERARQGVLSTDQQVPGTPCAYGDPNMERLLTYLLPRLQDAIELTLWPTYSYFRVYKRGDLLPKHSDREACEISLSLCLGGSDAWPLWIQGPMGTASIRLLPGDALLYRGIECPHWRRAFRGEWAVQAFLHYVDSNGPFADWKYDRRPSLAPS